MGVEAMTLCAGCNYPIPSWQHNGACKPVAEKVPPILSVQEAFEHIYSSTVNALNGYYDEQLVPEIVTRVTENPPALPKRRGRPKKDDSLTAAQKQAAYRARKQQ